MDSIKIGLNILPNGISEEGYLKYSLLIALCADNAQEQLKLCTLEEASEIILNDLKSGFIKLKYSNSTINVEEGLNIVDGQIPFALNNPGGWKNLLNNALSKKYKICVRSEKFLEIINKSSLNIREEEGETTDLYDITEIDAITGEGAIKSKATREYEAKVNRASLKMAKIDQAFAKINKEAKLYSKKRKRKMKAIRSHLGIAANDEKQIDNDVKQIDFFQLVSSFLDHPQLARETFGLIVDVTTRSRAQDSFINLKDHSLTLELIIDSKSENYYHYKTDKDNNNRLSDFEYYEIRREKKKYYHGRGQYGFLTVSKSNDAWSPEIQLKFSQYGKLQELTNLANSIDQADDDHDQWSRFLNEHRTPNTEGVIGYRVGDRKYKWHSEFQKSLDKRMITLGSTGDYNKKKKAYRKLRQNFIEENDYDGVAGHNIVVQRGDNWYSLCARISDYELDGTSPISIKEESWIDIESKLDGKNGNKIASSIAFKWEGQNLCVPKLDKQAQGGDYKEKGSSAEEPRVDHVDIYEFLAQYNFKYKYRLAENSGVMLSTYGNGTYNFAIREVYNNGYTFPIYSSNEYELSLSDLNLHSSLTAKHHFEIDSYKDPILAPIIRRVGVKDPESDEAITDFFLKTGERESYGEIKVYPPRISFQFLQFLGYLEPDYVRAKNKSHYLKVTKKYIKRISKDVPKTARTNKIDYLADPRGDRLIIYPNDWWTWMRLRSTGRSLHKFVYNKESDLYDDVKPAHIVFSKTNSKFRLRPGESKSYRVNLLNKAEFESEFNSKRFMENINKIIEYQSRYPYSAFTIHSVEKTPQTPKIKKFDKHKHRELYDLESKNALTTDKGDDKLMFFRHIQLRHDLLVKKYQLLYSFHRIQDDGVSLIDPDSIKQESKRPDLTIGEHSPFVFNQHNGSLENGGRDVVYPDGFAVRFQIPKSYITSLEMGSPVTVLTINEHNKVGVVLSRTFKTGHEFELVHINMDRKESIVKFSSNEYESFAVHFAVFYDFNCMPIEDEGSKIEDEALKTGLNTKIHYKYFFQKGEDIFEKRGHKIIKIPPPFTNLSYKNVLVNRMIEEQLIYSKKTNRNYVNFKHYIDDKHFFSDPNPDKAKYPVYKKYFIYDKKPCSSAIEMKFRIRALSENAKHFPDRRDEKLYYADSEVKMLRFDNTKALTVPKFDMKPLISRSRIRKDGSLYSERAVQIVIELDRPWYVSGNNEKLAILINANKDLELEDSRLARDISTVGKGVDDFVRHLSIPPYEDPKSLSKEKISRPYLKKYYQADDWLDATSDLPGSHRGSAPQPFDLENKYRLLLITPYYSSIKNKWMAILNFKGARTLDDPKDPRNNIYNPFMRIVLARIQWDKKERIKTPYQNWVLNEESYRISTFSNPFYMPLFRERRTIFTSTKESQTIKIENPSIKKTLVGLDKKEITRTYFVVFYLRKDKAAFFRSSDSVVSLNTGSKDNPIERKYHLLTKAKDWSLTLEYASDPDFKQKKATHLCIYEFEAFHNSPIDIENKEIDWLEDHRFRLLYMEEFKI